MPVKIAIDSVALSGASYVRGEEFFFRLSCKSAVWKIQIYYSRMKEYNHNCAYNQLIIDELLLDEGKY